MTKSIIKAFGCSKKKANWFINGKEKMNFELWFANYYESLRNFYEDFLVEDCDYTRQNVSNVNDGWDDFVIQAFREAPMEERFIIKS